VKILARARRPHGPTALLRRGSRPRKGRSGGSSHPRVAVVGCRAGQAPCAFAAPAAVGVTATREPPPALKVRVDGRPLTGRARAYGRLMSRKRRAEGTGPPKEKELRGGRPPPPCVSTEAQGASGLGSPQSGRARPTPGATKSVRGGTLSAAPHLSLDFQCDNWYKEGLPPVRGCAGAVWCARAGLGLRSWGS
jgi:hypothetical protein